MSETICPGCAGEGCKACRGVGVLGWEPPSCARRIDVYNVSKTFIQNLSTHALKCMALGIAGEQDHQIRTAQIELARRNQSVPTPSSRRISQAPRIQTLPTPKKSKLSKKERRAKLREMHPNQIRSIAAGKTELPKEWIREAKAILPDLPDPGPVRLKY